MCAEHAQVSQFQGCKSITAILKPIQLTCWPAFCYTIMHRTDRAVRVVFICLLAAIGVPCCQARTLLHGWWRDGRASCPPKGFDSVSDFDIKKYVAAPWYVQQQVPLAYQPPSQLYCVRAQYTLIDPSDTSKGLVVRNYANKDRVNGQPVGTSGADSSTGRLLAKPDPKAKGPTAASKLVVGPDQELKQTLPVGVRWLSSGPYWVVAAGPVSDPSKGYDWAIITGGEPRVPHGNGCRPGRLGTAWMSSQSQYVGGLWLFSRKMDDPEGVQVMRQKAEDLGLDTTELLNVKQTGCKYAGA